jgi:DNA (cytosine-5)-methyltransferase 1
MVYYNEKDTFAVEWLLQLIKGGHIADGLVDDRSIEDVTPNDLKGFTQCHFFAGIGGWSLALRLAGWPDDQPVWTGSCPCQPFSTAGKGGGFADERHLWPAFHWLIKQCRPSVIIGEQVEAAIKHGWLDLVQDDLEGEDYAVATTSLPAASTGAPQGRPRIFWVGDCYGKGLAQWGETETRADSGQFKWGTTQSGGALSGVALSDGGESRDRHVQCGRRHVQQPKNQIVANELGHADGTREHTSVLGPQRRWIAENRFEIIGASPLNGYWGNAEWLWCTDDKLRPVEPGTFPLAHGIPARMGRVRGYGNAIVPQVAAEVIKAYMSLNRV